MGLLHIVAISVVLLSPCHAGLLKPKQKWCGISPIYNEYMRRLELERQMLSKDKNTAFVVGGEETIPPGKWPWMVYFEYGIVKCGGSLITPEWIITAAHCFPRFFDGDEALWKVSLGLHNTSVMSNVVQTSSVKEVHRYPGYMLEKARVNDIVLVKLAKPLSVHGNYVRPLCLQESDKFKKEQLQREKCVVTGWGKTNNSKGTTSDVLREVYVDILPDEKCSNYKEEFDKESQICAGKELGGKDACREDSGGPLACFLDGRWKLVGVVSYGKVGMCGDPEYPGVYTNVLHKPFKKWIKDITRGKVHKPKKPKSSPDGT